MEITFLGTGTSTGVPEIGCKCSVCTSSDLRDHRLRASVLVSTGKKNILIDCGPDFRAQMLGEKVDRLDAILITHEHYDHTGGIDDLRPYCRHGAIQVYLEEPVAGVIRNRMPYCFREVKYPGIPDIELNIIENQPFSVAGTAIVPIRAMHYRLPVLGYRIGSFAYLTDVLSLPEEEYSKLKGVDVLAVNALRKEVHLSHQTLADALKMIDRIAPREAYLTHMSHQMGRHADISAELPPSVRFAYDRLKISF